MRYPILFTLTLIISFNASASSDYRCNLASHYPLCEQMSFGHSIKTGLAKPSELTGQRLDQVMWVLLEEPYKSDDKQFISYVREHKLIHRQDKDGDTVLSIAALNGQTKVIDYLAKSGIEIDKTNKQGNTVFDYAIKFSDGVRKTLLDHGADVNHAGADGRTPLINAILSDDLATVKFLLAHGAAIDHIDASGANALQYAAYLGNVEIINSLLESADKANGDTVPKQL